MSANPLSWWRWPGRAGLLAATVAVGAWLAPGSGDAAALPTTDDQLVTTVRQALLEHDLAVFDELVNWDGATKMKRRLVTYQMRYGFGRPIRSIALEPFPATAQATLDQEGRFKTNMPVSQQLRVVFDEPDTASGHPPTALFLVGRQDDAYRIALVVPVKPPGGRD
ncbi:MAG: hypothetical protein U1E17_17755 [Geminicoccaceae bacterium]